MTNIFAAPFEVILKLSDVELQDRIRVSGVVRAGLHDLPGSTATELLRKGLQAVYEPLPGSVAVIRLMCGRAHGHALDRYPSLESYIQGIYAKGLEFEPSLPTCLTGIAGGGKSQTIGALWRLLPAPSKLLLPDRTEVPLIPGVSFKIGGKSSLGSLFGTMYCATSAAPEDRPPKAIKLDLLVRRFYRRGCCFVIPDEWQFITSSADANALLTKALFFVTYLGVPMMYVGNYSLLHRLMERNHEDRQRLLSDVIRLDPEPPDSPALIRMLEQWCRVADGAFGFDPAVAAERFDAFTGGSIRAMRELAVISYRRKREQSPRSSAVVVTLADIESTYGSDHFSLLRADARLLMKQRITGKIGDPRRKDLWCPIEPAVQTQTIVQMMADREQQREVDSRILISSMTPQEVKASAEIARAFRPSDDAEATVKPVPKKRQKVTLEGLLARVKT